jgi:transposase InsO family protein
MADDWVALEALRGDKTAQEIAAKHKLPITRPNHVWCSDITYSPVRRGFLYLVAILWPVGDYLQSP